MNFQRSYAIVVDTLSKRIVSVDTKVKNSAMEHLNSICNISFVSTLCGIIDFYNTVAKLSCKVQNVDVMPWEVTKCIEYGISDLRKMAEECIICEENLANIEEAETTSFRIESVLWPNLSKHFAEIQRKEFSSVALSTSQERNMETRGQSDIDDVDFLTTLQS